MDALRRGLPLIAFTLWLAGCATTERRDETKDDNGSRVPEAESRSYADRSDVGTGLVSAEGSDRTTRLEPWNDPASPLHDRIVYFDFDSPEIPASEVPTVIAHARFLATRSDLTVVLEGHTDERGTREYNIALGEQRARAVSSIMKLHGVAGRQIDLVSYGEENPADAGHDEQSWRLNRRVEIVYMERR